MSLLFYNEQLRVWSCSRCEIYHHASKAVVKKHIDSKHMGYRYKCDFCDKLCPTLHAMSEHVRKLHAWWINIVRFLHLFLFFVVVSMQNKGTADIEVNSMLQQDPVSKLWMCQWCDYAHARKEVTFKHVDSKHFAGQYSCPFCTKICPTQHAMSGHIRAYHK